MSVPIKPEPDDNKPYPAGAAAAGMNFLVAVAMCGAIGYAIDHFAGSTPWGVLLGVLVGFIAGMYQLGKVLRQTMREED